MSVTVALYELILLNFTNGEDFFNFGIFRIKEFEIVKKKFNFIVIRLSELIKRQSCDHIETSQLTGFYMMATLAFNELKCCMLHERSSFEQSLLTSLFQCNFGGLV